MWAKQWQTYHVRPNNDICWPRVFFSRYFLGGAKLTFKAAVNGNLHIFKTPKENIVFYNKSYSSYVFHVFIEKLRAKKRLTI